MTASRTTSVPELVARFLNYQSDWHDGSYSVQKSGLLDHPGEAVPLLLSGIRERQSIEPPEQGPAMRGIHMAAYILAEMGPTAVPDRTVLIEAAYVCHKRRADFALEALIHTLGAFSERAALPLILDVLAAGCDDPSVEFQRYSNSDSILVSCWIFAASVKAIVGIDPSLEAAGPTLYEWLDGSDAKKRRIAAAVMADLVECGVGEHLDQARLIQALHSDPTVIALLSWTLGKLEAVQAIPVLTEIGRKSTSVPTKTAALLALLEMPHKRLSFADIAFAIGCVFEGNHYLRSCASILLHKVGAARVAELTRGKDLRATLSGS